MPRGLGTVGIRNAGLFHNTRGARKGPVAIEIESQHRHQQFRVGPLGAGPVRLELARDRLRKSVFNRSVINGELFNPQDAVDAGFLDKVVPAEQLMSSALAVAQQMKKMNMTAHKNTKLKVRKAMLETLDKAIELDQQHLG